MAGIDILSCWQSSASLLGHGDPQAIYNVAQAWTAATTYLDPIKGVRSGNENDRDLGSNVWQQLEEAELLDDLFDWYTESIRNSFGLVQQIVLDYLDQYDEAIARSPEEGIPVIWTLFNELGLILHRWLMRSEKNLLYPTLPPRFSPVLTSLLLSLLHSGPPPHLSNTHHYTLPTLLLLLERYDPLLFGLIYDEIERKVDRDCRGVFDQPKLAGVLEWLNGSVGEWCGELYARPGAGGGSGQGKDEAKKMLKPTFARFEYHVSKTLGSLRSSELFDIIVDYPNSKPALEDLKTCLLKTDQRTLLVNRLRAQMSARLLHPGADTKDIINLYISTIRCLRMLDSQGVLLSRVADPLRKYLRDREDTIRCIVLSLIEEGNPLVAELASSDARLVQDSKDEAENYNDPKWTPDPVDAPLDFRKSKGSDIIQLLVSIYDTKDVFVKELQVLLAKRLLEVKNYELDREIKNVEILKLRFGESSLQGLEVMLKDLDESKRIDQLVHEQMDGPLHATIVSRLFWPSFQTAPLKPPGQIAQALSSYEKQFMAAKPDKKLRWLPQLGTLNITLELKDRTITQDVTPLQASIVELFGQQETWTVEALSDELAIDTSTLKNGLYYWNNLGVVHASDPANDEWSLLETKTESEDVILGHVVEEEQAAVQSVDSQKLEQMRVFWQYISAMLTNLGSMPVTRIHMSLSALAPNYQGTTLDELTSFLEALQGEGLVEKLASNGNWKVVK